MADEIDLAQEITERHLEATLATRPRKGNVKESRAFCEDCDAKIPEARRKAMPGCTRCTDCQTLLENWRPL